MSKNRPPKSVYRRHGLTTKHVTSNRVDTRSNKPNRKKTLRSSTKASRVQSAIDCWLTFQSFHPTVKRVTAQLGEGWAETTVRQILEVYGPKNGIFLTEFERNN